MERKISVILPVYNGAEYLRPAIDSVLRQSFSDFEFIIINDGSKDTSAEIVKEYKDARIKFIDQKNQGLSATLNLGIKSASYEYLARQDQDDISHPDRFKMQIDFLNTHPDCVLLGTWARIMSADGQFTGRMHEHPTNDKEIRAFMCINNPFVHSSVIFKKKAAIEAGLYSTDGKRQPPEDYEFWSRLIKHGKAANIPEFFLDYREVPTSMSRAGINPFLEKVILISAENMASMSGNAYPLESCLGFARRLHGMDETSTDVRTFRKLIRKIRKNLQIKPYSQAARLLRRIFYQYQHASGVFSFRSRLYGKARRLAALLFLRKRKI